MAANGRIQLIFLPSLDDVVVDVETTLNYVCSIIREGVRDDAVIAVETQRRDNRMSVSVTYDETYRCHIYVTDDREQLVFEATNWCNLYGAGLSNEAKQEIIACPRRLDLYCDPDREHIYDHEFDALTQFLQLSFKSRYALDPSQSIFLVSEI